MLEFYIFLVLDLHKPLVLQLVLIDLRLLNTLDIIGSDRLLLAGGVIIRRCYFLIYTHRPLFFFINIICLFKIIFVLFILNIFILSIVSGIGLFLLLILFLFSIVDPEIGCHSLHLGIFFINRVIVAVLWVDVLLLLKFLIHLLFNMVCLLIVQI